MGPGLGSGLGGSPQAICGRVCVSRLRGGRFLTSGWIVGVADGGCGCPGNSNVRGRVGWGGGGGGAVTRIIGVPPPLPMLSGPTARVAFEQRVREEHSVVDGVRCAPG